MKMLTSIGCGTLGALLVIALAWALLPAKTVIVTRTMLDTRSREMLAATVEFMAPGDTLYCYGSQWELVPFAYKVKPPKATDRVVPGDITFGDDPSAASYRIVQLEMALAQAHATADSLRAAPNLGAYVGDLCVRVDRLEALMGIGGADE